MKTFIEKMQQIEKQMSEEHGPFELFAVFRPDSSLRLWDVLVSARWMSERERDNLRLMAKYLNNAYSEKEIVHLSGVVIVPPDYEGLRTFQSQVEVEHGLKEFRNVTFFEVYLLHAYVITSRHHYKYTFLSR